MAGIRIIGANEAQARFDGIVRREPKVIARALNQAGYIVAGQATKNLSAGVGSAHTYPWTRKGFLKNSIVTQVDPSGRRAYVGSGLVYAPVHEFGATIRPKTKPYLVFFVGEKAGSGHWVRTKQVTIPPRPYLGPALDTMRPAIKRKFAEAISKLLAGKP